MKVAIQQPCYLPWRGYFALMKLADVFIHLDDVALPQGRNFQTRVQLKTPHGKQWLTVPVQHGQDPLIRDVQIAGDAWQRKHLRALQQELPRSVDIVADEYRHSQSSLLDLNVALINRMATAFALPADHTFSSALNTSENGWRKLLQICRAVNATTYITAHGARNYFAHEAFENAGVDVFYLDYDLSPYPQPHGTFDPYVTALDVLAHAPCPLSCIGATLVPWRDFIRNHGQQIPLSTISQAAPV